MRRRAIAIVVGLVIGCGGKLAEDDHPWNTYSGGVSSDGSGPSYAPPPLERRKAAIATACSTAEDVGSGDDSCLGPPPTCDGPSVACYEYEDPSDLEGGSWGGDATSHLTDGAVHYHVSNTHDEVTQSVAGPVADRFHATVRMKVTKDSGNVTVMLARIPLASLDEAVFDLELVGSTLQMCAPAPASGHPACTIVGPFARDLWHTIFFSLEDNVLTAKVDCNPEVQTEGWWYGDVDPDIECSIDYGIMWPTCATDVYVDIARGD